MSKTLYENATHRKGPIIFDGTSTTPSELGRLKKDMDIELSRALQFRSSVFEPSKIGVPNEMSQLGGVYGSGFKIGATSAAHMDRGNSGATKEGGWALTNDGAGTLDNLTIMGPSAFGSATGKELKFYFKGSIGDVSAVDFFCGLAHDAASAGGNFPNVLLAADGTFSAGDGIGFLKPDAAASVSMTFAIWDGNSTTDSTQTVTFPATVDDGTTFECGFIVHDLTSITVFMKVGSAETVQLITRVSSTTLDLLASALQQMGPAVGMRVAGATSETVTVNAMAATQSL